MEFVWNRLVILGLVAVVARTGVSEVRVHVSSAGGGTVHTCQWC